MVGRFSLAVAGWLVMGGASMPTGGDVGAASPLPHRAITRASAFHPLELAQRDSIKRVRALILAELNRPLDLNRPLLKGRPALMERRAKMSKLLVVLDALSAGSEDEYHRIIARLGVGVTGTSTNDATGKRGGPSAEGASSAGVACDWTDDDGNYWSGECASQQQIDDAAALLVATNADMDDVAVDAANDVSYCQQVLNDCWETNDPLGLGEQAPGGPSAEALWCASPFKDCYAQTVSLGLSMAAYYRQAYKLGVLVTAIAPPAGAIFDTAFGLAVIAGGAYLAGRAFSNCLLAT